MSHSLFGLTEGRQPLRQAWSQERLQLERALNFSKAHEPGTLLNYASAARSFVAFCDMHALPVVPNSDTLSLYATFMSAHIEPRSVNSYLSNIVGYLSPFFPNAREERNSLLVSQTMAGCFKRFSNPVKQKRPLTEDDLLLVLISCNNSFDDQLFAALTMVGFRNLHRLGELVWPDELVKRSHRKLIKRSSVARLNSELLSYHLPYNKADKTYQGHVCMLQALPSPACPVKALNSYIAARDARFPYNPELFLREDGTVPTRSWYMARLRRIFGTDVGGHSLRAGGATALALAGVPEHLIQRIGRWASEAFQIYIRSHPILTHLAIQRLAATR